MMRKIFVILICMLCSGISIAQSVDTIKVEPKPLPLTQMQRDSLLKSISKSADVVAASTVGMVRCIGRYKMYRTSSMYINLKLDTATGEVTAVQIGMNKESSRMVCLICEARDTTSWGQDNIGRYELYPTGNNYNFILLDTAFGDTYQVQWSTKQEECFALRIY